MGVAVADADAEEVADAEVEVGVIVEVTLSVVGTDVGTWTVEPPDWVAIVVEIKLVVR